MSAEIASIRRHDPDLDAGDIAGFTLPILVRALGVLAIGVVPLLVVRNGATENSQLVPIIGSLALVIICAAVVAWLTVDRHLRPGGHGPVPHPAGGVVETGDAHPDRLVHAHR